MADMKVPKKYDKKRPSERYLVHKESGEYMLNDLQGVLAGSGECRPVSRDEWEEAMGLVDDSPRALPYEDGTMQRVEPAEEKTPGTPATPPAAPEGEGDGGGLTAGAIRRMNASELGDVIEGLPGLEMPAEATTVKARAEAVISYLGLE